MVKLSERFLEKKQMLLLTHVPMPIIPVADAITYGNICSLEQYQEFFHTDSSEWIIKQDELDQIAKENGL